MRFQAIVPCAPLILAFAVTGCVLSIHPIVPDSGAIFDERLLGRWEQQSGSESAMISRAGESSYAIEYVNEDGKTGRFAARLGRLGDDLVLDVWSEPPASGQGTPREALHVPGHLILPLRIDGDEMRLDTLEPDSLLAACRNGQVKASYALSWDRLVLLGDTGEVRAAVGWYRSRYAAPDEGDVWRRADHETAAVTPSKLVPVPCFEASPWREADALFRGDPYWLGADVASTVELGHDRILWLFGDTWIDPTGKGTRHGARIVSNSVGIQKGLDPTRASITFYWGTTADGRPQALFPDPTPERLWFGNGIRVDDRLVLFFDRIRSTDTGLGFESAGWTAMMVENPDAEPSRWQVHAVSTPENPLGVLVGFAAIRRLGEYVYAFGSQNPVKTHPIYVARWRAVDVAEGRLLDPEWWAGDYGWVPDSSSTPRWPLFDRGQAELTIHFDETTHRFLAVHTSGFGPADVLMRAAPALTGTWSKPQVIYRPPEYYRPNVMIYAGKAHPALEGADLVLTYATNTTVFAEHVTDADIYYPRFVRLTRCP